MPTGVELLSTRAVSYSNMHLGTWIPMCQSSTLKASILVSSGMKNEPSFIALASLLRERIASLPPELGAMLCYAHGLRIVNKVFSNCGGQELSGWTIEERTCELADGDMEVVEDDSGQPAPQETAKRWRRGFYQEGPKPGDVNEVVRRYTSIHLRKAHDLHQPDFHNLNLKELFLPLFSDWKKQRPRRDDKLKPSE